VLAHDRRSNLWDAARLLSVGEEGYAYRRAVGAQIRAQPEYREISQFFTAELGAQLADSRATTTAKLDAPVNKLARLLNSPSIKRVLLNTSLTVDFDRLIAGGEVLIVKGALGAMGAGNTSVLMQMLLGMLDAALARQQDLVSAGRRVPVALKIDEAPLVINQGFAETMALKRSAGLETVACWQTDAQWTDRDVREQLDALFAHRVYFATSSTRDARAAVALTMSEFSDTVRPGIARLSSLGAPGARLHLPKHHAVASWCTEAGRQSAFVAQTIPMRVDRDRLAAHAAAQHARGARHMGDLRQPHWDRPAAATQPAPACELAPPAPRRTGDRSEPDSAAPASESFRELVEMDRASHVRLIRVSDGGSLDPDELDLAILSALAALGHVLSSQLHRRFNRGRAPSTTQRRLKRLADAGLVERLQFHRADGGGVPMCYSLSRHGWRLVHENDGDVGGRGFEERSGPRADRVAGSERRALTEPSRSRAPAARDRASRLRQARHEIHVAGWVLALAAAAGADSVDLRGGESLHPPRRPDMERGAIGPEHLRLPGGRVPHDFLRTELDGRRAEVERFDSLRPDAVVEIACGGKRPIDLLVERDDRPPRDREAGKLERYEHFIAGWSAHTERYGRRARAIPVVVFLCRDRPRARECARAADRLLCACRAYAGEYPFDWDYSARGRVLFAAERDMHDGISLAYAVPPLPPAVRVSLAGGDPRHGESAAEASTLPLQRAPASADREAGGAAR
jgi:hypothetical protein